MRCRRWPTFTDQAEPRRTPARWTTATAPAGWPERWWVDTCTGPVHAYAAAGLHTITVQVTDADGFTGWDVYEQQAFAFSGFLSRCGP